MKDGVKSMIHSIRFKALDEHLINPDFKKKRLT
jgi:hypothetical protein